MSKETLIPMAIVAVVSFLAGWIAPLGWDAYSRYREQVAGGPPKDG